jgi:hypothetical protein
MIRQFLLALGGCSVLLAQSNSNRITNTSDSTLAAAVTVGSLIPANSTAIASGQVQFQIRNRNDTGYRLDASATFTTTTTAAVSGGATIAASDIGVGITSVIAESNVIVPRTDSILSGFNYDPTAVPVTNGLTPYRGAASGQATVSDLLTSKQILNGPKIAQTINFPQPNALTVTIKAGILPQYFTPCSFTAVITLTLSNGP